MKAMRKALRKLCVLFVCLTARHPHATPVWLVPVSPTPMMMMLIPAASTASPPAHSPLTARQLAREACAWRVVRQVSPRHLLSAADGAAASACCMRSAISASAEPMDRVAQSCWMSTAHTNVSKSDVYARVEAASAHAGRNGRER